MDKLHKTLVQEIHHRGLNIDCNLPKLEKDKHEILFSVADLDFKSFENNESCFF